MGQVEETISLVKEIEYLLESIGAVGRGLHEKLSSVENQLPFSLVKVLRYIATVRNKLVHEHGFQLNNFSDFKMSCRSAIDELKEIITPAKFSRIEPPRADSVNSKKWYMDVILLKLAVPVLLFLSAWIIWGPLNCKIILTCMILFGFFGGVVYVYDSRRWVFNTLLGGGIGSFLTFRPNIWFYFFVYAVIVLFCLGKLIDYIEER